MNFKKFLALGVAGASVLTGGFLLSGCDMTKDDNSNKSQVEQSIQQEKAVTSIKLIESSIPNYIIRNKFYRTNIRAVVTYEDKTTKEIAVTEDMIEERDREDLKYVGQYNLKINYGGKSTTMYTKVVDERYLLKEVVEANAGKDVTMTEYSGDSIVRNEIDVNNDIYKMSCLLDEGVESDFVEYAWLSNGITYMTATEGSLIDCYRDLDGSDWKYGTSTLYIFKYKDNLINESKGYTINSVELDEDTNNYILEAICPTEDDGNMVCTYEFNDDFLLSVTRLIEVYHDTYEDVYKYDYSPVTLEVPAELKAMEKDAIIDAYNNAEVAIEMINNTLNIDFSATLENEEVISTIEFDANNKILHMLIEDSVSEEVYNNEYCWLKGDYVYNSNGELDDGVYCHKLDKEYLNDVILLQLLGFDICNFDSYDWDEEEPTITIDSNGNYVLKLVEYEGDGVTVYGRHEYTFNANGLVNIKVAYEGVEEEFVTINYSNNINLTVPDEYIAYEEDAVEEDYDWWLN